ncbi:MAG: hypothetical protein F4X02_16180 [Chloroflexi bacterium]|nr:hypothetical protein [Chloroflexota bacterium]
MRTDAKRKIDGGRRLSGRRGALLLGVAAVGLAALILLAGYTLAVFVTTGHLPALSYHKELRIASCMVYPTSRPPAWGEMTIRLQIQAPPPYSGRAGLEYFDSEAQAWDNFWSLHDYGGPDGDSWITYQGGGPGGDEQPGKYRVNWDFYSFEQTFRTVVDLPDVADWTIHMICK